MLPTRSPDRRSASVTAQNQPVMGESEEAGLPGSEPWDGWAVSAGTAHKALGSVSPGRTPASSA